MSWWSPLSSVGSDLVGGWLSDLFGGGDEGGPTDKQKKAQELAQRMSSVPRGGEVQAASDAEQVPMSQPDYGPGGGPGGESELQRKYAEILAKLGR